MRGWRVLVVAAALTFAVGCREDTGGLGNPAADGGLGLADTGTPTDCDDGIPCTEDVMDVRGVCTHVPRHDRCTAQPCQQGLCEATRGCIGVPADEGAICADGPPCQPYVCQSGQCRLTTAPDGAPCLDGDECTVGDHCEAGACAGTPSFTPPEVLAHTFMVDAPPTATFIRDRLLVEARSGDRGTRWVVQAAGHAAPLESLGIAMAGSARLVRVDAQHLLRLDANPLNGVLTLERIDDDGGTGLTSAFGVPVGLRDPGVPDLFTVASRRALYCATSTAGQAQVHAVSVDGAGHFQPVVPVEVPGVDPCAAAPQGGQTALGGFWARWENAAGQSRFTVHDLGISQATLPIDFTYDPAGAEGYGAIEAVAVDASGRALVAVANHTWALLAEATSGTVSPVRLDGPPSARLLAVRGQHLIFQDGADLVIYVARDPTHVQMFRLGPGLSPGPARLLDADGSQLALVDSEGWLRWFVPFPGVPYGDEVEVYAQGSLRSAVGLGRGVVGWSRRHLFALSEQWLRAPSVANAPGTALTAADATLSVLQEGPNTSVLVGRPVDDSDGCLTPPGGFCPADEPVLEPAVPVFDVLTGRPYRQDDLPSPVGPWGPFIAQGRTAWHLERAPEGGVRLVGTARRGEALVDVQDVDTGLDGEGLAGAALVEHEGALTVRLAGGGAALLRTTSGLPPLLGRVEGPGRVLGAAFWHDTWTLMLAADATGSQHLETYRVQGGQATLTAAAPVPTPQSRWLGEDGSVFYTDAGGRVTLWRVSEEGSPEALRTFEAVSPPLSVVSSAIGALLVRPDGVTLMDAACR